MKHILAAIDFSDLSETVIANAGSLAHAFGARITLLHVAAPDPEFVGYEVGPQYVRDNRAGTLREEHSQLLKQAEELRSAGLKAEASLVEGATVDTILERAQAVDADLIIIGAHAHGALHDALLGSVSRGVIKKAKCPVLVIPA